MYISHPNVLKIPLETRETATPEVGQGVAGEMQGSYQCNSCRKILGNTKTVWRCLCCKLVIYCDVNCQKKHWLEHKTLCNEIKQEIRAKNQNSHDETHSDIFVSHLTPKQQQKVVSLIGRRCSIKAKLNEKKTEILWDTGAQVSIILSHLLGRNLPNVCIRGVEDSLDGDLNLTAANGSDIPYCGYVELNLQIALSRGESTKVSCRVNTGPMERKTPVLFEVDENPSWPNGLHIANTLLTINAGKSSRVEIEVTNETKHEIV